LFVAGASGQVWAVLAISLSLGGGVYLVFLLRGPILAHLDDALARDRSFSVAAFAARPMRAPRMRSLAAVVVLCALAALVLVEALALRWTFEHLLPHAASLGSASIAALVLVAAMQALASGHAAALHVAQLQFGLLYLGVFGSLVLVLYAQAATLVPLGRADALLLAIGVLACVALAVNRRRRYVDTDAIRPAGLPTTGLAPPASIALRLAGKVTNQVVSTLVVVAIVIAGMALYGAWSQGLRGAAPVGGFLTAWGVALLCLILVLHPLVDLPLWQQLAALRLRAGPADLPEAEVEARVRSTFRAHALQALVLGVVIGMLGVLTAVATGAREAEGSLSTTAARLRALDADLGGVLLPCLALALIACALTTVAAQFSAMLVTIRHDLARGTSPAEESTRRRRSRSVVLAVALAIAAGAWLAPPFISLPSVGLMLLVLVGCGQLALLPAISHWRKSSSAGDAGTSSGQSK